MSDRIDDCYRDSRPYTRWWWFSGEIREEDVRHQLDWLKENNFGGVEIAWVYALPDAKPGTKWLSDEWSGIVAFAKSYAAELGLGCDFTFGTLWPFGGSIVAQEDASRVCGDFSEQRLRKSWEARESPQGYILNHLDRGALERYSEKMGGALEKALAGRTSALFCDSWEVATENLWAEGFEKRFREEYGYDITEHMPNLDGNPDARYDYRKLIAKYVLEEFYKPYTEICNKLGGISRVQCHGAPTDLVAAYAAADVPESEAILFDPHFSSFASSAAAIEGKTIVSAEAFTCLYGWKPGPGPAPHIKRENAADIKLLADGLFANGVNMIVWHGMPYNPPGGNNEFYASVHVGPDGAFAGELPALNAYMEKVSDFLRRGRRYTDIAVYLPLEDNLMKNLLPEEMRRPSAHYHWELQYQRFPEELSGHHPTWVTGHFLTDAKYANGKLNVGEAEFTLLYIDVEWLDSESLDCILHLAEQGLPVCVRRKPEQPGFRKNEDYEERLEKLFALENVKSMLSEAAPLIDGNHIPEFQCRIDGGEMIFFFANPKSKELKYPMKYGQSYQEEDFRKIITLNAFGKEREIELVFEPYQSLLLRISRDATDFENIIHIPESPSR